MTVYHLYFDVNTTSYFVQPNAGYNGAISEEVRARRRILFSITAATKMKRQGNAVKMTMPASRNIKHCGKATVKQPQPNQAYS